MKRTGRVSEEKYQPHGVPSATPGSDRGAKGLLSVQTRMPKTGREVASPFVFLPSVAAARGLADLGCTLQKGEDTWKRAQRRGTD